MITIVIHTSNAAFQDGNRLYETARILRDIADSFEKRQPIEKIRDANGNGIGKVTLTGEDR